MTFLPIVARELRVAARRSGTYWARLQMALLAILCGGGLAIADFGASQQFLGQQMFHLIGGLALIYCLLAGRLSTADCLSSEKREGTRGLLFLTDLKGYDVVLGKLAATSLRALYGLLAIFPMLAIPLLLGGITSGEFWRVVLVLVNTFLFSLAIGIFVSAISRDARRAMAGNFALLLLFVMVFPLGAAAVGYFLQLKAPGPMIGFFFPCPIFSGAFALAAQYKLGKEYFWWSVGVIHGITWLLLLLAGWIVPRTWQDKPAPVRAGKIQWRELWHRWSYGNARYHGPFRKRLLDTNAFYWLAGRARLKPLHVWIFLGLAGCWWMWGRVATGTMWLDETVNITLALILNSTLKLWVALEAGQRLAEDQKIGALELLLTTPLTAGDIVRGQMLALRRQFLVPTLAVIGLEIILMVSSFGHSARGTADIIMTFAAGIIMLAADMTALSWVAMARGLAAKSLNHAIIQTITRVLVLPGAGGGVGALAATRWSALWSKSGWTPGWNFYLGWWVGFGIFFDLIFALHARRQLQHRFRQIAMRRYDPVTSRLAEWLGRLKRALVEEKAPALDAPGRAEGRAVSGRQRKRVTIGIGAACVLVFAGGGYLFRKAHSTFPPPVAVTVDFSKGTLRVFPGMMGAFWILPDGSLWRWGQPGGPRFTKAAVPERVGSDNDWIQAVASYDHCVGLRADGTIWEWGWRGDGRFGSLPEQADPGRDWTGVAAGQKHALALKHDGTLWAWGENAANQLGNGPGPGQTNLAQVGTNHDWAVAQCLWSSSIAVRTDGTLWMWGQIPRFGSGQMTVSAQLLPIQLCEETNWAGLSTGTFPILARTRSGEMWNPYYGAPDPDAPATSVCRLVASNSAPDHIAFAFMDVPTLYELRSDGTLWERGYPYPMGSWNSTSASQWRQVGSRTDWVSIWGGVGTAIGLTSDGVIWMWGQDPSQEPTMDFSSRVKLLQRQVRSLFGSPMPGMAGVARSLPCQKEPRPLMRLISAGPGAKSETSKQP